VEAAVVRFSDVRWRDSGIGKPRNLVRHAGGRLSHFEMNDAPETPSVSVVVIVLNGAGSICACLEALTSQDYPRDRYEIIVVDNGSTDGTVELVKRYPVRVVHELRRGYSPARNAGVKATTGAIVAFTDADCFAEPDWLRELVRPYRDPGVGVVGGAVRSYLPAAPTLVEAFIDRAKFADQGAPRPDGLLPFLVTRNVSYRKVLLEQAGLFDVDLPMCEDVDMSRRVQLVLGATAVVAPTAVVRHKHHDTWKELASFMRRDGYGEMLMAARWKIYPAFQTHTGRELRHLLRQCLAMAIYLLSFLYRCLRWPVDRKGVSHVAHPVLWLVAESANVQGKIHGLIATRLLRSVPGSAASSQQ
jgi:glycosyltransferase involved in cell wall biosynthesis